MSDNSEYIQVEWLVRQIEELDQMIGLHHADGDEFMIGQYASRRLQYFKELISLLATSRLNTTGEEIFPLINALTEENYNGGQKTSHNALQRTLIFYQSRLKTRKTKGKTSLDASISKQSLKA